MMATRRSQSLATLGAMALLLLAVLFWASNTVIGRLVNESIPAFSLSFWRWGLAAALIVPFSARRAWGQRRLYRRHWRRIVMLSVLNVTAYNTMQYWALDYIEASSVGVVAAAMPAVMFVFAWILGIERASGIRWLGLAVALAGIVLILGQDGGAEGLHLSPGEPIIVVGVLCFGLYSVLVRNLPDGFDGLGFLGVMIAVGWLAITPFYLVDLWRGEFFVLDARMVSVLLYVAVFPSVLANGLWLLGLRRGGPLLGAMSYNFLPVFICLMAVPVLGEAFTWIDAVGIALVLLGANARHLAGLTRSTARVFAR